MQKRNRAARIWIARGALALSVVGATWWSAPFAVLSARDTHPAPASHSTTAHATTMHPNAGRALASTNKPSWRGDATNSGVEPNVTGPASQPSQVFEAYHRGENDTGIQLDSQDNILFNSQRGAVYSYAPSGALNWSAATESIGSNQNCSTPSLTLSSNGAVYLGGDKGNLYEINPQGVAAGGTAPSSVIFSTGGARLEMSPTLGTNDTLYLGDDSGAFHALTLPSPGSGSMATQQWSFNATGSTQAKGVYADVTSGPPFLFCGQAAVNSSGTIFVASTDSNPNNQNSLTLGTVYALKSDGTVLWKQPLQGPVLGAVVYDAALGEAIVADEAGEVFAFRASDGTILWSTAYANQFRSSPTLSPNGKTVYVADNNDSLYAIDATNGTAVSTFGTNGVVTIQSNSSAAPTIDKQGNIYTETGQGIIYAISPTGLQLWSIASGSQAGQSGSVGAGAMSPAIASNGTAYFGGNLGRVRGFQATGPAATSTVTATPGGPTATSSGTATGTPTGTATGTSTSTGTATSTAVPTDSPSVTSTPQPGQPTDTPANTPSQTATPVNTGTATTTSTNSPTTTVTSTGTGTATATPTGTATATPTRTATATGTGTVTPTTTGTVVLGPASGWSHFRGLPNSGGGVHNDGVSNLNLDLSGAPGPAWNVKVTQNALAKSLAASPALGADGIIYEPDGYGRLVAINPDGSIRWTSSDTSLGTLPDNLPSNALGSSPAVAANGTVYAGSANGGIYAYVPPTSGTSVSGTQFFSKGRYPSSSVVIGPDGIVYAESLDGHVYAARPDGSQKYDYQITCPAPFTVVLGSTPALDKSGNLYAGFACVDKSTGNPQVPRGGVVSLDPSGTKRWTFSGASPANAPGGAIWGPLVLSPDESRLFALDVTQYQLYGISTSDGSQKWVLNPNGQLRGAPALSPDGSTLYLSKDIGNGTDQYDTANYVFLAINASDGSVIKKIGPPDVAGQIAVAAPAVDSAGDVLFGTQTGEIYGFAPKLDHILFKETLLNQTGIPILGGPVIGQSGSGAAIYVANSRGLLAALKVGVVVPTPMPTATTLPSPVGTPVPPTSTPLPPIVAYSATPTPKGGSSGGGGGAGGGSGTGSGGNGGGTGSVGIGGPGGGNTSGGPAGGVSPTPTTVGVVVKGAGFSTDLVPGTLDPGNLSKLTFHTPPGARISFTAKVVYLTTPAQFAAASAQAKVRTTSAGPAAHADTGTSLLTLAGSSDNPAFTGRQIAPSSILLPARSPLSGGVPSLSVAAATSDSPVNAPRERAAKPKTSTPRKAAQTPPGCPIAASIVGPGTYTFTRVANKQGLDQFCLKIGAVPSKALGLRIALTVQVTAGSKAYPSSTITLLVPKVLHLRISVLSTMVYPKGAEAITVRTEPGAALVYRVPYGTRDGKTLVVRRTVGPKGVDTFTFKVPFTPSRTDGLVVAPVKIDGSNGPVIGRGAASFTVVRRDAILQLKRLALQVLTPKVRAGGVASISTVSARTAYLVYTVQYGSKRAALSYAVVADGSGYATLRFPVTYKPGKGKSVQATVSIKAELGHSHVTGAARFQVQG